MKKLCILMPNMNMGGAQVSLIHLLKEIDQSKLEIKLFLFDRGSELEKYIPSYVKIEYLENYYTYATNKYSKSVKRDLLIAITKLKFGYVSHRISQILKYKKLNYLHDEQKIWKIVKDKVEPITIDCDFCLSYMQGTATYFLVDKVKTNGKIISMFNTDYEKANYNKEYDYNFFKKLDNIVCVSNECCKNMRNVFNEFGDKIICIEDVFSKDYIMDLSNEQIIEKDKNTFLIVTCARLAIDVKGYDFVVNAAKMLNENGYDFKWLILGDGAGRQWLEHKIKEYKLEQKLILMGNVNNPYPYIKNADCLVQASRFEGKGRTLIEAKILGTPVVSTNFDAAYSVIDNNKNGFIVDMNASSIYNAIAKLIGNQKLIDYIVSNIDKPQSTGIEKYNELFGI